jgi:hypothetical protein
VVRLVRPPKLAGVHGDRWTVRLGISVARILRKRAELAVVLPPSLQVVTLEEFLEVYDEYIGGKYLSGVGVFESLGYFACGPVVLLRMQNLGIKSEKPNYSELGGECSAWICCRVSRAIDPRFCNSLGAVRSRNVPRSPYYWGFSGPKGPHHNVLSRPIFGS